MSRLARSSRDWHQLLEIFAFLDTLIAIVDGVYDPTNYNDRLLLGLKGTMSEAELHILKARMLEGRKVKARRQGGTDGIFARPSGEVVFHPDEQAEATIRLCLIYSSACERSGRSCAIWLSMIYACQFARAAACARTRI